MDQKKTTTDFIDVISEETKEKLEKYQKALEIIIEQEQIIKDLGFAFEIEIKSNITL